MSTNINQHKLDLRRRLINIEEERRVQVEAAKDLCVEYRNRANDPLTADEIAAVKLSVRRRFEAADKRDKKAVIEADADAIDLAAERLFSQTDGAGD